MTIQSTTVNNTFNMYGYTANSYAYEYKSYVEKKHQMMKLMYYYDNPIKKKFKSGVNCIF